MNIIIPLPMYVLWLEKAQFEYYSIAILLSFPFSSSASRQLRKNTWYILIIIQRHGQWVSFPRWCPYDPGWIGIYKNQTGGSKNNYTPPQFIRIKSTYRAVRALEEISFVGHMVLRGLNWIHFHFCPSVPPYRRYVLHKGGEFRARVTKTVQWEAVANVSDLCSLNQHTILVPWSMTLDSLVLLRCHVRIHHPL